VIGCPACGTENPEHARFCLACGTALAAVAPALGEERKVVSVLFADLVGFTSASDQADPEDVLATLRPYHALLRTEIERYGGTVEKFIGDAVMAVFGAPVAHEDDAERAVRAGLRIIEALAELNAQRDGPELAVRVAVNSGEAIVTLGARPEQGEGMVAGDVVNTTSRLQQVAPVGGVVVGEGTWRATQQMIDYEPMDPVEVKGKAQPIPVWRAIEARSRFIVEVDRPTNPFIGRDSELELLRQAYRRMIREESVQLVTVTGEPGVGKSRLIGEFFTWADAEPELFFWRHGRCLPYGDGVTFWALGEIVKAQAGVLETDGPDEADAKLRDAVALVVEDEADRDWISGQLAGLVGSRPGAAASADRAETFSAWRVYLEAMAVFRPLILIIEDLHWADDAMIEFVEYLAEWATGVPLLILCTARPELYERRPGWGGGKRNSTTVALSPLQEDEIAALVSAMLEETLLPADTQAMLLERAGGNPLYAEEFVRMLTDRGILRRQGRAWQIVADGDIPVPDTVQALIAARIDTLSPERKTLLHDAAVIGRVFWPGALAEMAGTETADVVAGLHDLLRKELVRPVRRSTMQGEDEFTFWHILVRDVAYAQIPRARRAARHRKAAGWIESAAGERVSDHADILAHHYLQALELGGAGSGADDQPLRSSAGRYLYLAAERATQLDKARGEQLFRRALELVPAGSLEEAEARTGLGQSLLSTARDYAEAIAHLEVAEPLFARHGQVTRSAFAKTLLALALRYENEMERSRALMAEARQTLEGQPPGPELARVYTVLGGDAMLRARFGESMAYSQQAIDLSERLGRPELAVRPLQFRGWAKWDARDAAGAKADLQLSVEMGHQIGEAGETAIAYNNYAGLRWDLEGPSAALETEAEGMAFAARRGLAGIRLWMLAECTYSLYDLGRWDDLLAAADEVEAEAGAGTGSQPAGFSLPQRVKVEHFRGHPAEAAAASATALPAARDAGDPQLLIPALEGRALLDVAAGRSAQAVDALLEIERISAETSPLMGSLSAELVRVACQAGDLALAHRLVDTNPAMPGRSENIVVTGQALIAEAEGRTREAADGYLDAAGRWATYGSLIEQGHALLGAGRCLLELGLPAEASDPLRIARELFAAPGAIVLVAQVDDLLARTTARAG
jgi:class 3 adenylate cyclase/tetratricopeptide (TPR) repeat protein